MAFPSLGLLPILCEPLAAMGLREPTPVQRVAVPALLGGANVIAVARTGSGKTLAYALPLLQRLRAAEDAEGSPAAPGAPRAIVLTGTRELVDQTVRALKAVAHPVRLRVRGVAGGMAERVVGRQLSEGADVLVANPPRLAALVRAGRVRLDDVRVFVADEGDTLLAPGQREEVEELLRRLPATAQVAWFSATLPEPVRAWILARQDKPVLLLAKDAHTAPPTIGVRNLKVRAEERADTVHDVLVAAGPTERGIVFCNRRETAEAVGALLVERGHDVRVIHGGRTPPERRAAMASFRRGEGRVLVTTELGGRGLHVEDLAFVVNYELPERPSEYLHRIGRVGRASAEGTRTGRVVNLVTPHDEGILREVERLAKGGAMDTGEAPRAPRRRDLQAAAAERRKDRPRGPKAAKPAGKPSPNGGGKPAAKPAQEAAPRPRGPAAPRRGAGRNAPAGRTAGPPKGGRGRR
ncbi:MAG: putative ATP-dependent helicase RhlE [Pseudomonadota bacterium]